MPFSNLTTSVILSNRRILSIQARKERQLKNALSAFEKGVSLRQAAKLVGLSYCTSRYNAKKRLNDETYTCTRVSPAEKHTIVGHIDIVGHIERYSALGHLMMSSGVRDAVEIKVHNMPVESQQMLPFPDGRPEKNFFEG